MVVAVSLVAMASHRIEELRAATRVIADAARQVGFDQPVAVAEAEDELYDDTQPYEDANPSVPYDYEQIARAA